jgi:3D (Asp-Asp-Asp) domain-containing protein
MAAGNAWPFGTRLHVEGVGVVVVQDRYGWGTQLDLFMDSCAKARAFGRRHLRVEVAR